MEIDKGEKENMTGLENLSELVKDSDTSGMVFSEEDLDFPIEDTTQQAQEETVEAAATEEEEVQAQETTIHVTNLSDWFESNCDTFENINQVKVSIRGVDPKETLIITIPDGSGDKDESGNEKRLLKVFENANVIPVLNLAGVYMDVYNNNTFKVEYAWSPENYIKTYGIKGGLICVGCLLVDGNLIPYNVSPRVKKTDKTFEISLPTDTVEGIQAKMEETVDMEALQLLYKQISKASSDLTTKGDAIKWLLERQKTVTDINHHLQIDNVIINILN